MIAVLKWILSIILWAPKKALAWYCSPMVQASIRCQNIYDRSPASRSKTEYCLRQNIHMAAWSWTGKYFYRFNKETVQFEYSPNFYTWVPIDGLNKAILLSREDVECLRLYSYNKSKWNPILNKGWPDDLSVWATPEEIEDYLQKNA